MSLAAALVKFFSTNAAFSTLPTLVLIGVSGGPDSLALLHALTKLPNSTVQIQVAHLDHCLRGTDSKADAQLVTHFAQDLGLPYHLAQFDVAAYARQHKLGLEAAARAVRYAFFAHIMSQQRIQWLLLAHTADDQAETVLLHLLRGSGPHGLGGIQTIGPLPLPATPPAFEYDTAFMQEAQVGRPLLEVWRSEIETYCATNHLQPRFDQSNADPVYMRNRVRLQLLPLIEQDYKQGFKKNLTRLASLIQTEQEWLEQLTTQAFASMARMQTAKISFDLPALYRVHRALQGRLLRLAYQKLAGSLENLESVHLQLILDALAQPLAGSQWKLELPAGIMVHISAHSLIMTNPAQLLQTQPQLPDGLDSLPLSFDNELTPLANDWFIETQLWDRTKLTATLKQPDPFSAWLDYAKVGPALQVRLRLPGDKLQPLGAPGHRKLQDVLVDAKIPAIARPRWPIVVAAIYTPTPILWVPGCTIAEPFKVTDQTNTVLMLRIFRKR